MIFENGSNGRCGIDLEAAPELNSITENEMSLALGNEYNAPLEGLTLPEKSEPEVCRHFTRLSQQNFSIDTNTYPLGSCTMKYNPKINEWAARLPGFAGLHPYAPEKHIQGALSIIWDLQNWLSEIGGFAETSMQPAAGAQGEFVGVMMIKKALAARGEHRKTMLVPASAHGTNPATAAFFGYQVVSVQSNADGRINLAEVRDKMNEDCVGIMITNPNTLGIFEKDLTEISHIIHDNGGYVYGDGANLNALMGITRPGDLGTDVMHFNLHKTFTTPHGGGGPGCGAVGAAKSLARYLPRPMVAKYEDGSFYFDEAREQSIGKIRSFYGNFGMMVRAWTYMREMGGDGLRKATELAVLNSNYVRARLKSHFELPFETDTLHEVVFSDNIQSKENGITTMDMAKRLIDFGIHPPTVYFPLVVHGALMIEPTETETKHELDQMCDAFVAIAKEAKENPQMLKEAPHVTRLCRLNEAQAARDPVLKWAAPLSTC